MEQAVAADSDDRPLADRPSFVDVYAPAVPVGRRMAALAAATADIYARSARLFLVLQEAAGRDAAAADLAVQASSRRLEDHRRLAALVLAGDSESVSVLADVVWVLAGPGVYVDLVHRRGWPSERYVAWLADQLSHAAQPGSARPSSVP